MPTPPLLRRLVLAALLALAPALPARACSIALVLAVDVSGSVDAFEYQLQVQGIANALRDPEVGAALLQARAALALMQWSGSMEQSVSIPFTPLTEPAGIDRLAARIGTLPRAHDQGNTAVGEAISIAADLFDTMRHCAHWVIDVSGDGDENEGFTLARARREAWARGITINGLAIEGAGTGRAITNFYERHVVTPGGFVITAERHEDFARAMREKLLRELQPPVARVPARPALWLAALPEFLRLRTR